MSDSLRPHGLQHTRPPCPLPTPGVYSNSCPLNWWCHPTISSSVVPFSSLLQSFPASGSFPMSQLFVSGGQSIGVSASASVLPMNIQGWFPLGFTDLILLSKGLSTIFSSTTVWKHQFFSIQPSLWSNFHICTWGGQSTGVSALASVLPKTTQDWSPLEYWLDLLAVQKTPKSLLQCHSKSMHSLVLSFPYSPTLTSIHDYWKNHSFG